MRFTSYTEALAVKHDCDDSVDNIRYPHGHKCRRKTRKGKGLCYGHKRMQLKLSTNPIPILRPMPPLTFLTDSDIPIIVKINAAAVMA